LQALTIWSHRFLEVSPKIHHFFTRVLPYCPRVERFAYLNPSSPLVFDKLPANLKTLKLCVYFPSFDVDLELWNPFDRPTNFQDYIRSHAHFLKEMSNIVKGARQRKHHVEKKIRQCHLEVKEACQGSEVLLT
jgi:hypothetical protein